MGRQVKKTVNVEKESTKDKLRRIKKEKKQKLKQKRARLVIKNLPFDASEENVREYFATYGEIEDVKLLKKEDGHSLGCGFVQFKLVQKAKKARHHLNEKEFLGRKITVDFALAKDKYITEPIAIKQEEEVQVKIEPVGTEPGIKEETDSTIVNDSEDDEESVEEEEDNDEEKPKYESNDISEGKTIFIKNVPFSVTNEELKECMKQFGPVYYALICIDKFTEHSKGTAFVKFINPEDGEKALNAGTELTLNGNVLDCHKAVARQDLDRKKEENKDVKKDSRNLFLVREGVVLAGSKAAEGVSASDMSKRLQLEQYKSQMLRNLNMFVSKERLVVHNLPASWDDKKFRALMEKNSSQGSVIKEARIMRDLKAVDASGVGKSKEFGFVSFTRHSDALMALRNLNNNPNIFSETKRPIVAFSIENKVKIQAKQKRLEKSRTQNPKCKDFKAKVEKPRKYVKQEEDSEQKKKYVGVEAKAGVQKMRSRFHLKTQAKLHHEYLKKVKKEKKFSKKTLRERQKDFIKQPKQKINKKATSDNFSKLVANYKKKLLEVPNDRKKKWHEG